MSSIKSLVEASQWAQCLDKIRSLEILPLEANGDPAIVRAYAAKFPGLSQPVSINVPNLLMWTVLACTRQREQLSTGAFSGNEGTRRLIIEQMRQMVLDLTTYTSQLRRALSEAISLDIGQDPLKLMPVKPRDAGQQVEAGSSLSLASIDDPVELARTMMSMYERDAMFHRRIQDQNRVACRVLLEMSSIKSLVEASQWAQCLDV
ncbi:hypothetical protein BN1723_018024, partial [Verticillium longisporum]